MKPRPCPGCRQERHPTQFIEDSPVCGVCRELGPQYPIAESMAPSAERLVLEEEGKMPRGGPMKKRPCAKGCGKLVDPRGAHKHEERCSGPQGGGGPSKPAKRQYRRRKVTARDEPERRASRRSRATKPQEIERHALGAQRLAPADGCQVCGLNVAERELVAEAIRVGLSFDNAVGFVRHSRAVFGQKGAA